MHQKEPFHQIGNRASTRYWLVLLLSILPTIAAAERGISIQFRESEAPGAPTAGEMRLYSSSHALVIGIDEYQNGWPRLSNAVADAKKVSAALEQKGFDVTLVTDLNGRELEATFEDFFIDKGADPESRLFVWYAGHGHTVNGEGYLIPSDGVLEHDRGNFLRRSISLRDFGKFSRLARSKHVFTIFDSCFAGTIFNVARSAPPPAITRITSEPVRQFLSSGDAGQTVSDDGTFATLFVEALNGERRADLNADGYVTAEEIGSFLTNKVSNYTSNKQVPRHGKLQDPAYDKGDFVFLASLTNASQINSVQVQSAPGTTGFSLDDITRNADNDAKAQAEWENWQNEMEAAFNQVRDLQDGGVRTEIGIQAWQRFIDAFDHDNPYSQSDTALLKESRTRLQKLQNEQRTFKAQTASIDPASRFKTVDLKFIERKLRFRTRLYLVAGGDSYQPGFSGNHSPFSKQYLTALRGSGGSDGILTKAEVKSYMEILSIAPRMGDFGSNELGSDFVFVSGGNPKGTDRALVIGIGDYQEWSDLETPVGDARAVAAELRNSYGFSVDLVTNPTKRELQSKLAALRRKNFAKDDQLLIYIAGHGMRNKPQGHAFIVPSDGRLRDPAGQSYLSLKRLRDQVDKLASQHTMLVIDAVRDSTLEQ